MKPGFLSGHFKYVIILNEINALMIFHFGFLPMNIFYKTWNWKIN